MVYVHRVGLSLGQVTGWLSTACIFVNVWLQNDFGFHLPNFPNKNKQINTNSYIETLLHTEWSQKVLTHTRTHTHTDSPFSCGHAEAHASTLTSVLSL